MNNETHHPVVDHDGVALLVGAVCFIDHRKSTTAAPCDGVPFCETQQQAPVHYWSLQTLGWACYCSGDRRMRRSPLRMAMYSPKPERRLPKTLARRSLRVVSTAKKRPALSVCGFM